MDLILDSHFSFSLLMSASEPEKSDKELLKEYYTKFKGMEDDKKYALIPKFYSKVSLNAPTKDFTVSFDLNT